MIALLVIVTLAKTIKIIPQARSGIVERFGRYKKTLSPGLNFLTPWIEKVRYVIDMREQVVSFPPQPVITEDNLVVSIDTVIYFQVTNPVTATYEIANYIQAIEQLTMTTLRQITGGMTLEHALTGRDQINGSLRGVLDEATGRWGIRVNRVELKGIDPPPSIKDAMEKQMRAERDKRAAILTAEGERQSSILTAEGDKQSSILSAEGDREAAILRAQAEREASILKAQGEGQAIQTVFQAIHDGNPDQSLLAYQYLQMMPKIAEGDANKVWIVPSEIGKALEGLGHAVGAIPDETEGPQKRVSYDQPVADVAGERLAETHDAVAEAIADARSAAAPGGNKQAQAGQEPPASPPPGRTPAQGQPPSGRPNPPAQPPTGNQQPGNQPPRNQPPGNQPPSGQ
ncbi:MAG: SPFH/Band 7/PHB domain protein [Actinomycetia bacterium]|nr:SPFH/Band 7/PHB domain protein [Actinomycetes bacterium]